MGDSSEEDMAGLGGDGASDEEKQQHEGAQQEQQDFEDSLLTCIGCEIKNTDVCPIAKRKNKHSRTRVQWGKSTSKKVLLTSGQRKKRKVQCGQWCLICTNIFRLRLLKQYTQKAAAAAAAKGPGNAGKAPSPLKLFGTDLTRSAELRGKWKGWRNNYIKQRADGRNRVSNIKERVEKKQQTRNRMIGPKRKFYTPAAFKRTFKKDYQSLKLKLRTRRYKGKEIKGVVVAVGEEGVFDIETDDVQIAERAEVLDDGDEVLSDGQLDECMAGAVMEQDDDAGGGAVSMDTIMDRIAALPQGGAVAAEAKEGEPSDENDSDSEGSSDSSSQDGDDDPKNRSSDEADKQPEVTRRRLPPKVGPLPSAPPEALPARPNALKRVPLFDDDARSEAGSKKSAKTEPGSSKKSPASAPAAAAESAPSSATKSEVSAQSAWCDALTSAWASGAHDQMKGRQKNTTVREWMTKLSTARNVNRKADDSDLERKIDQIQAIADFAKVNVPGANHVQLLTAWDTLRLKNVKSSETLHEIIFMRHAEHMLATDGVQATLVLFDGSHPRALTHLEETLQKKCAASLATMLMRTIFPSSTKVELTTEVIDGARSDMRALLEKLTPTALPSDVASQPDHLRVFLTNRPEAETLAKALEMCKQAPSTMKSSLLGIFAGSKVGKSLIRQLSILSSTLLKDQVKQEELVKTKDRVLQAIRENGGDKNFVWNLLDGFLDAVRGMGEAAVAASLAEVTLIKDSVTSWTWRVLAEMMIVFARSLTLKDVAGVTRCSPSDGAQDQGVTEIVFRAAPQTQQNNQYRADLPIRFRPLVVSGMFFSSGVGGRVEMGGWKWAGGLARLLPPRIAVRSRARVPRFAYVARQSPAGRPCRQGLRGGPGRLAARPPCEGFGPQARPPPAPNCEGVSSEGARPCD